MTLLPSTSTFPFPGSSSLYGCKGFPLRSCPRCLIRSHESPQALKEHPFPYLKKPSQKHLSTPPFTTPLVKTGSHVQTSTNQSCDNWKGTTALPTKKGRIFTEGYQSDAKVTFMLKMASLLCGITYFLRTSSGPSSSVQPHDTSPGESTHSPFYSHLQFGTHCTLLGSFFFK